MSDHEASEYTGAERKQFRKRRKMAFILVGSMAVYMIALISQMAYRTLTSVPARGVVTDVGVVAVDGERSDSGGFFEPSVGFRYTVAGVTYVGTGYQFGGVWRHTRDMAMLAANEYAPGDSVTVHVNPDDPAEARLRKAMDPMGLLRAGVALLVMGMMYWFHLVWRPKRAGMITSFADWY